MARENEKFSPSGPKAEVKRMPEILESKILDALLVLERAGRDRTVKIRPPMWRRNVPGQLGFGKVHPINPSGSDAERTGEREIGQPNED